MTPERFQAIDEIFHLALERSPAERVCFIAHACSGDHSLRQELFLMIEAYERRAGLLNKPAYEILGFDLLNELTEPVVGQTIGRYRVLEFVAEGGMGNIYLALDTSLRKKVALKILPFNFSQDKQRVRRFEQEARLASAADHPNICVIHEISRTDDGRHFIVMEYVDGITLRERVAEGRMGVPQSLDVGIQIAGALEAAHALGIIHRDIKPENIMLRKDGYVKVLDFGIAKLNEDLPRPQPITDEPLTGVRTEQGLLMGTVKYMSPEQLELTVVDSPVDRRSDIWSLGVVLHEMVTGVTPFEGLSTNEIVRSILDEHPPQLSFSAEVPADFQQIVKKALSKRREGRYQTVRDLDTVLKQLRRRMDRDESLITQVAEDVFNEIRKRKIAAAFAGIITIFAISLVISGVNRGLKTRDPSQGAHLILPFQKVKITPLTNSGKTVCAVISPDGNTVAHAEERNGKQELLLTSIADPARSSVLIPATESKYLGLTFTPDGHYLYIVQNEKQNTGVLYQLPIRGGSPRKIKDGLDSPISFSPAGDRFAHVQLNRTRREYSLVISSADGTEERVIATRPDANTLVVGPAWSPDGKTIVCAAGSWSNGYRASLVEFDVATGHERILRGQKWFAIFQVAWLPDKTGLIVSAIEQAVGTKQLWRVAYPTGESESITSGAANYESVSR
jgi:serine/threonine protein kinase